MELVRAFRSIPVRPSSQAGLLAGSEHSGIGGLPHVAGVSRENIGNCVYMDQGILEHITIGQRGWEEDRLPGVSSSEIHLPFPKSNEWLGHNTRSPIE